MKQRAIVLLLILASSLCAGAFAEGSSKTVLETQVYLNTFTTLRIIRVAPDAYVTIGADHQVFVVAEGFGALHYQWYFNGHPIPGGSGSTPAVNSLHEVRIPFDVLDFSSADAGQYTIVITDDYGHEVTSEIITLRRRSGGGGGGGGGGGTIPRTGDDSTVMWLLYAIMAVSGTCFIMQMNLYSRMRRVV